MEPANWFYQAMGEQFGPVAWAELQRLAEERRRHDWIRWSARAMTASGCVLRMSRGFSSRHPQRPLAA